MSKPQYNPNNPFIQTFTGRKFYFLHIRPEDICIEDIAHALSNICRYSGQCKVFYSVAEHSIKCCEKGSDWLCQMWGLLHDASEAYIGDIPGPFKTRLLMSTQLTHEKIDTYEELIAKAVAEKFNLPWPIPKEVHRTDKELLDEEMEILWGNKPITTMTPEYAERAFLSYFKSLELNRKDQKMTQTTKCIRCGKLAKMWGGHVLKRNGKAVLAGWCGRRCMGIWNAYHGPFSRKYGEEKA